MSLYKLNQAVNNLQTELSRAGHLVENQPQLLVRMKQLRQEINIRIAELEFAQKKINQRST